MSKIAWTDESWNPVTGCTKVSAGCANCYAQRTAKRLKAMGQAKYDHADPFAVRCHPDELERPLRWKKPRKIFVNSMSDLFHEDVPFEFIDRVFDVMERASWHTFQVLTKRPERMVEFFGGTSGTGLSAPALPNVWLGTSVENQAADERIPHLLECPAAVKFLSIEPLLGPLDLTSIDTHRTWPGKGETSKINALQGYASSRRERFVLNGIVEESGNGCRFVDRQFSGKIDWVIVGGESGPGARPMETDWVRAIRDQCVEAKVPFFFKQWGTAKWVSAKWVDMRQDDGGLPVLDGRTWAEMPG